MTTEQQLQEKIEIIISNIQEKLNQTKTMVSTLGNHKISHKGVKVSMNDLFNFSKMDIVGFVGYLFLSKQNKEVFGDLTKEQVSYIFCEDKVVSKKIMDGLVKGILK